MQSVNLHKKCRPHVYCKVKTSSTATFIDAIFIYCSNTVTFNKTGSWMLRRETYSRSNGHNRYHSYKHGCVPLTMILIVWLPTHYERTECTCNVIHVTKLLMVTDNSNFSNSTWISDLLYGIDVLHGQFLVGCVALGTWKSWRCTCTCREKGGSVYFQNCARKYWIVLNRNVRVCLFI